MNINFDASILFSNALNHALDIENYICENRLLTGSASGSSSPHSLIDENIERTLIAGFYFDEDCPVVLLASPFREFPEEAPKNEKKQNEYL